MPHRGNWSSFRGTSWHWLAVGSLLLAVPAGAQEPAESAEPPQEAEVAPEEEPIAEPELPPERAPDAEPEQETADAAEPIDAPQAAASLSSPVLATTIAGEAQAEPAPPSQRPRGWRLPRETVRRPLTLPQGVLRFDSIIANSVAPVAFGSRFYMSGYAAVAAGLFDDLELGTTPVGITWIPLGIHMADPYVYARVRALSGDAQIAFRAGTTLPVTSQPGVARMELGTELAFLVDPMFRIDTGVDYSLLFSSPLNQRIGIPVTGTVQLSGHAIGLTLGVYVFNDFDDVDVPLLLRYTVAFGGYQGPYGEWALEGGFTDLEFAEKAWTVQSRFTFFAYP